MPIPTSKLETTATSSTSDKPATDNPPTSSSTSNPVGPTTGQEKTQADIAAEKLYEERMEDEYAKREGGA